MTGPAGTPSRNSYSPRARTRVLRINPWVDTMSSTDESRVPFDSRALVRACSVVTLVITLLAFAGWQLDLPWLRSFGLSTVGMNPLTALGLLFGGAALWLSDPAAAS